LCWGCGHGFLVALPAAGPSGTFEVLCPDNGSLIRFRIAPTDPTHSPEQQCARDLGRYTKDFADLLGIQAVASLAAE
jgi:hypothetical protein